MKENACELRTAKPGYNNEEEDSEERRGEERKRRERVGSRGGESSFLTSFPIDKPHFSSIPRRFPHRLEPHLFFLSLHRLQLYFYHPLSPALRTTISVFSKPSKSTHAPPSDIQNVVLPTTLAVPICQYRWRQHDHYGQLHLRRQGPLRRVHMRRLRFTCVAEAWRAYPLQELWTPRFVQAEDQ